jgi:phage shock protein E
MKRSVLVSLLGVVSLASVVLAQKKVELALAPKNVEIVNPAIDMNGYLRTAREAAKHRESRRVTEADFLRMSQEPGTIILDARSREGFDELHIKGAVNLSFPDIAIDSVKQTIPDKSTHVLIYCNNNFFNAPRPFPPKNATASLNLSTYIALYNYGYRNVYELGPLIDIEKSILPFESSTEMSPRESRQPRILRP